MFQLNGAFQDFVTSLFGFVNELLRSVFGFLTNFLNGLHVNIS